MEVRRCVNCMEELGAPGDPICPHCGYDQQKEQENQWYTAKVVSYDQGLRYCRLTGNRSLFEALLMSR